MKTKQRTSWARTKKKKIQKAINAFRHMTEKRAKKLEKETRQRGTPFVVGKGNMVIYARKLEGLTGYYFTGEHKGRNLNQRQKRKHWRNNPHARPRKHRK